MADPPPTDAASPVRPAPASRARRAASCWLAAAASSPLDPPLPSAADPSVDPDPGSDRDPDPVPPPDVDGPFPPVPPPPVPPPAPPGAVGSPATAPVPPVLVGACWIDPHTYGSQLGLAEPTPRLPRNRGLLQLPALRALRSDGLPVMRATEF